MRLLLELKVGNSNASCGNITTRGLQIGIEQLISFFHVAIIAPRRTLVIERITIICRWELRRLLTTLRFTLGFKAVTQG